jgi:hypothetical protein
VEGRGGAVSEIRRAHLSARADGSASRTAEGGTICGDVALTGFLGVEIEILYISNRLFVPSLHLTLLISSMDNYFLLIPSPFGVGVNLNMDNG